MRNRSYGRRRGGRSRGRSRGRGRGKSLRRYTVQRGGGRL